MKKEIPIWGEKIPFNSNRSKYDDMVITKSPNGIVLLNWVTWVFGKKLKKDNHGHDDYLDRLVIKKGQAKTTYEDVPTITPYIVKGSKTSVVIAPGGGFCMVSTPNEGTYPAEMLNRAGISAFVLNYRLEPYRFPIPCLDVQRAIRYVRAHAEEFGVPRDSVGAMGFSAGGYAIIGSAEFLGDKEMKIEGYVPDEIDKENGNPDYLVPIYPVVSFDGNPNMLANLKGGEFYTDKKKREEWKRKYSLIDNFDSISNIPQFMAYGTKDMLTGHKEYADKILKSSVKNGVLVMKGAGHGYSGKKKWNAWEKACCDWIEKYLSERGAE